MQQIKIFILLFLVANVGLKSSAQDIIRQVACKNEAITLAADSIKKEFSSNGFIVVKEANISMESEFEMPVVIPLTEGTWYHFVFIGDKSSKLTEMRMYDWEENKVAYEKNLQHDKQSNIISWRFIPTSTQFHVIKTVQVNKKSKSLCGYILMMKKVK